MKNTYTNETLERFTAFMRDYGNDAGYAVCRANDADMQKQTYDEYLYWGDCAYEAYGNHDRLMKKARKMRLPFDTLENAFWDAYHIGAESARKYMERYDMLDLDAV